MQKVYIPLEQSWKTIEDAVAYLAALQVDLKVLLRLPDEPLELYLEVIGDKEKGFTIVLTNL